METLKPHPLWQRFTETQLTMLESWLEALAALPTAAAGRQPDHFVDSGLGQSSALARKALESAEQVRRNMVDLFYYDEVPYLWSLPARERLEQVLDRLDRADHAMLACWFGWNRDYRRMFTRSAGATAPRGAHAGGSRPPAFTPV